MATLLTFLAVISILIIIHEAGHLIAAKLSGIRADEFAIGMGPKLITLYRGRETTYTIRLFPIGGYVNLAGENGTPTPNSPPTSSDNFYEKSVWVRGFVLSAGVIMNYLLGVILIAVVLVGVGEPSPQNVLEINSVGGDSPAQSAGLTAGQFITGYSDTAEHFENVTTSDNFVSFIHGHNNTTVKLNMMSVSANNDVNHTTIELIPRVAASENDPTIGISFNATQWLSYQPVAPLMVPSKAVSISFDLTKQMIQGLSSMFRDLFLKQIIPEDIAGPIGIAKITGEVAKKGLFPLIQFTALISINLAVVNILPFPALDGGRLLFVVYEGIFRRKLLPAQEGWIHAAGIVFLLALLTLISYHDIIRFF